jgi:hypothetical protein
MGVVAMARQEGFNIMETIVSIITCLLFVPPVAGVIWIYAQIVRDSVREERDFYAARAARQHGKG